jgi:uncharacterized membrane protein YcaP (DUF421 family)
VSHLPGVWYAMFHLGIPATEKIIRSVLVYVFLVVALRLVGKRELGQTNTLDLVVLLLIANAVQNGIIGNDLSVTGAVVGAVTLFAINELFNRTTYLLPWTGRALEGDATYLVKDGKPDKKEMFRASISLPELRSIARRQGYDNLDAVKTAILETNGAVSIFDKDVTIEDRGSSRRSH